MAPNGAMRIFVPTNPDLADILDRTDLDFESLFFFIVWTQISGFPGYQISKIWPLAGLGLGKTRLEPGQTRLEPSGPKNVDFLLEILVFD